METSEAKSKSRSLGFLFSYKTATRAAKVWSAHVEMNTGIPGLVPIFTNPKWTVFTRTETPGEPEMGSIVFPSYRSAMTHVFTVFFDEHSDEAIEEVYGFEYDRSLPLAVNLVRYLTPMPEIVKQVLREGMPARDYLEDALVQTDLSIYREKP